jgi:hypothetical protein
MPTRVLLMIQVYTAQLHYHAFALHLSHMSSSVRQALAGVALTGGCVPFMPVRAYSCFSSIIHQHFSESTQRIDNLDGSLSANWITSGCSSSLQGALFSWSVSTLAVVAIRGNRHRSLHRSLLDLHSWHSYLSGFSTPISSIPCFHQDYSDNGVGE